MSDNSRLICEIVDLIHDGRGVGRPDGKTCFIEGALPGETVEFRRHNQKRNYDEAHVLEVISASTAVSSRSVSTFRAVVAARCSISSTALRLALKRSSF